MLPVISTIAFEQHSTPEPKPWPERMRKEAVQKHWGPSLRVLRVSSIKFTGMYILESIPYETSQICKPEPASQNLMPHVTMRLHPPA